MPPTEPCALRERLRRTLRDALRARDAVAAGALRSAIAAIDNAEAVPAGVRSTRPLGAAGLGATEVRRRELDAEEMSRIVRSEAADRMAAAAQYERLGQIDAALRMRSSAELLAAIVDAS